MVHLALRAGGALRVHSHTGAAYPTFNGEEEEPDSEPTMAQPEAVPMTVEQRRDALRLLISQSGPFRWIEISRT